MSTHANIFHYDQPCILTFEWQPLKKNLFLEKHSQLIMILEIILMSAVLCISCTHAYRQVTNKRQNKTVALFCCGAFYWQCPLVPLERRVTANQHKVILIDYVFPVMNHFYPDGSDHFHNDNVAIHRESKKAHCMVYMKIIRYGFRRSQSLDLNSVEYL